MTMRMPSGMQVSSNLQASVAWWIMFINWDVKLYSIMSFKQQSNFTQIFSETQTSSSID